MADTRGDYYRDTDKQARYRDLLEAKESGAQAPALPSAVDAEIADIERKMQDGQGEYWHSPEMQARYRQLVEIREGADEPDGFDAPAVSEIARNFGLPAEAAAISRATAAAIEGDLTAEARQEVNAAVLGLPDTCRAAVVREFGQSVGQWEPASAEDVAQFAETGAGKILAGEWRDAAPRHLGIALGRWDRLTADLSDDDFDKLDDFYRNRLTADERAAVLRRLAA